MKKRKYGHKSLHKKALTFIYSYINTKRKEKYSSYETWAGKALISRTIASRISRTYKEDDEIVDLSLSTLLHMAQSLDINLSEMFLELKNELGDTSKEYNDYVNDEANLRD